MNNLPDNPNAAKAIMLLLAKLAEEEFFLEDVSAEELNPELRCAWVVKFNGQVVGHVDYHQVADKIDDDGDTYETPSEDANVLWWREGQVMLWEDDPSHETANDGFKRGAMAMFMNALRRATEAR